MGSLYVNEQNSTLPNYSNSLINQKKKTYTQQTNIVHYGINEEHDPKDR